MNKSNLIKNAKHLHFIGIGGVSMNLLARYFFKNGKTVSGSDIAISDITKQLQKQGIKVFKKHKAENILGADIIIINGAIKNDNPEYMTALKNNIPIIDRADLLNFACRQFKFIIAISGTHGKTTTCAMLYNILKQHSDKVSCHIGGDVQNARFEKDDNFLVLEACEFNQSFLHIKHNMSVVLNVEKDHLDSYKNFADLQDAFKSFMTAAQYKVVCRHESTEYLKEYCDNFVEIDIKNAKIENNRQLFEYKINDNWVQFDIAAFGSHNISDAVTAINCALMLNIDVNKIKTGLKNFTNVKRRFEIMGRHKNNIVLNDYAHHPTEINCFLNALKLRYDLPVVCVFQPHTFSRTALLFDDFVKVLSKPEMLVVYKEYSARETIVNGKSALQLFEKLKKINENENANFCQNENNSHINWVFYNKKISEKDNILNEQKLIFYAGKPNELKKIIKKIPFKHYILCFVGAGSIINIIKNVVKIDKCKLN